MALAVVIMLVGIISLVNLPVEHFPDIAPPVVEVSAEYTGASAEAVQKSVIVPIEEAINGVDGIDYISSSSTSSGSAYISVTFKSGIDPDMAVVMVKNRIAEVEGILPQEVLKTGVHVEKDQRVFLKIIALECPDNRYDNDFITNYFNINLSPRLQRIKGVSRVQLLGNIYAMRIWMDPKRMAKYNLTPSDVEEALNAQNIEAAIGTLGEDSQHTFQYTMVYRGRLINAEEFSNIVIKALPTGGSLLLGDVARCELGTENYSTDGWINSHNGTVAILTQGAGSNAREVNHEIDRVLQQVKPQLPPGLEFKVLLDTNHFLDASVHEVSMTLIEAIILVVLIVLLFIQNGRATLIPAIAIIVSLIGTFIFLYVAGFSLNLITLFALVLVIGTVVDDAIVVVEAVQSEFEKGTRQPYQATLGAMGHIGTAVITTTIVFMCVFIPTSFMSGLSGTYYKQFGLTMAVAVAISTLNALTLSPALCALLMRPKENELSTPRLFTAFNTAFATIAEKYFTALTAFMRHKWMAAGLTAVAILLSTVFLRMIPTSLVPDEDTGNVLVEINTPAGSTLEQTKKSVLKASKAIEDVDEIESVASVAGWSILGGDGANTGLLIIKLKHWDERSGSDHTIDAVIEKIEQRLDSIKSADMFAYALPTVTGYGFSDGIELNIQSFEGDPIAQVKQTTDEFAKALEEREEIGAVYNAYKINFPQYTVSVNAAICKRYGIEASTVLSVLNGYIGSNYASQFNAFGRLYHVMLQADPELRADADDLNNIFVATEDKPFIPITELVSLKKTYGLQSLNRFNLFSSISVEVEPADGYSSGEAIKAIEETSEKVLPQGYGYEFTGTTREEVNSSDNTVWVFVIVLLFIYLVLCSLYESLLIPLAVLLSVPFGLVGCCVFALAFGLENNIYMQVGIIMIIGLLSKTAILLTEYASARRRQGLTIRDAALEAAKARLRPIIMTAMTLIIGLMPLAFASGAGAVGNMSLGLCVIGGMTLGTLSLLFFVPLFFMFFQWLEEQYLPSRVKHTAAVLLLFTIHYSLFTSCKTYSSYESQQIATDSLVRSDIAAIDTTSNVVLKSWRDVFTDPQLAVLIEEGLQGNSDLRIAHLHIDAAKAELRQAKGSLFPSLELKAEGETNRLHSNEKSDDNEDENITGIDDSFGVGPEVSWEVDIFGKMRNARKAAVATVEEKQAYAQAVQVELVATIATGYYRLAMLDAQMADTRAILQSWDESIRAQKALMAVGEATSDEVAQAEASRLEAETRLEDLQKQMLQAEHALCTVLGRKSGHVDRNNFQESVQQLVFADGIPVQALAVRPDVRQAESALKSAFYLTNEARAAFYPSLTIGGQVGWAHTADNDISLSGLLTRAFGSLTMPIFAQGRLKTELRKAKAEQEEARINFQQAVIKASQEVNDILAEQQFARKAVSQNEQRIEKLNHVLQVTETRMRYQSEVNFLQVLLARQSLLEARLPLIENRFHLVDASIQLYRALGGGAEQQGGI